MEGVVLAYGAVEADGGIITGNDGARYRFTQSDWKSPKAPVAGHRVDFVAEGDQAMEVYLINPVAGAVHSTAVAVESSEKTIPTVVYACYVAAFLYGITMIVGVVMAYIYRGSAEGKWYKSHFDYQISIFWKSLVGFLIALPLTFLYGLGVVIMLCTYIWVIVKIIKGWRALAEGRAVS